MAAKKRRVPQFPPRSTTARTEATRTSLARYEVDALNAEKAVVVIECFEGAGNVPKNAGFAELTRKLNLKHEFDAVVGVARTAIDALKVLAPNELEIEFGVEMGGEMGIPLVTKGQASANFKITLKWSRERP
jgi:hypothetical protein